MILRIIISLLLLSTFSDFAEANPKKDPIDIDLEASLAKESSTGAMLHATNEANKKWDHKMNSIYQTLKKKMTAYEWTSLVAAQKAWINYRDLQIRSLTATYSKMEGTMWFPVHASDIMEITKQRALFLESLLATISER